MDQHAALVRERLLSVHESTIRGVLGCADELAATWDGDTTTDRAAVVAPLECALEASGVLDELPGMLVTAVGALDSELPAEPVAAPPYVAVSSLGPVLRATLSDGRLVVTIRVFCIQRGVETRYVRDATTPADALIVEYKPRRG